MLVADMALEDAMKTVTFRTSLSPSTLALMCNAGFCPISKDAFSCPLEGSVDCENVRVRQWEEIMKEETTDESAGDRAGTSASGA